MGKKKEIFSTHDVYLSAFLALSGIQPALEMEDHLRRRVTFQFPVTDELYHFIAAFNRNVEVPILDFTTTIKKLRAKMLTMRDAVPKNEVRKGKETPNDEGF